MTSSPLDVSVFLLRIILHDRPTRNVLSCNSLCCRGPLPAPGGPDTVNGVQNLKVVVTITNTGDEALKLLNDPRGPLDTMPTDTFAIQNDAAEEPDFVGIQVKYVPSVAVAIGGDDAFTVLAPGQSVDVEHDCKCRLFVIFAPDVM